MDDLNLEPIKPPLHSTRVHGGETILLVEEEKLLRELMSRVLRKSGYRILEASNGWEAIGLWKEHRAKIDLLYTDMTMSGGMNGSQLCRILRQDEPALRAVISSGYTTELSVRPDSSGAKITHLPKPCSPDVLVGAVRACLAGIR